MAGASDPLKYLINITRPTAHHDDDNVFDRAKFQAQVSESLESIENEIDEAYQSIAEYCHEQIQNNDVVMTIGYSHTVFEFFKEAAQNYEFNVVVVENSPKNSGQAMSKALAREGINTTLISDSSVFAYMSKIGKIIISTRAIMADGGLITDSGVELVVLAASSHSVPVIVISALYKLTPKYPFDSTTYNTLISPELVFDSKKSENADKIDSIVSFKLISISSVILQVLNYLDSEVRLH